MNKEKNDKQTAVSPQIRDALKLLGFTDYYVNIYTTLLARGEMNAHELSEITGVPYSRIYEVLNEMCSREMITKIDGRPSTFIGNDPQEMYKCLKKQRDQEFQQSVDQSLDFFKELYGQKSPAKKIEMTLYEGLQACRDHLRNVINASNRTLWIVIKDFEEIYEYIKNNLDFLKSKSVEVRLVVEERLRGENYIKELQKTVKLRFSGHINHNMLVSDEKTAFQSVKAHFDITKPSSEDYVIFTSTNLHYVIYITEVFRRRWDNAVD